MNETRSPGAERESSNLEQTSNQQTGEGTNNLEKISSNMPTTAKHSQSKKVTNFESLDNILDEPIDPMKVSQHSKGRFVPK
jgi:hypothetical protein